MKTRSAISTSVAAVTVIVLIVLGGGAYYYYTQVSSGPQKTIGVVFDVGGRGDLSFNDMAALGADNVAKQLLGCPSNPLPCEQFLQSASSNDYVTNLAKLASLPNPPVLIVAVGFLMTDALNQTAKQYPNQNFAIIDGFLPGLPNVLSIQFRTDQGAAVAGALAALATSCYGGSKVGLVLGIEIPVLWTFEIGYKWGVSWAYNFTQSGGKAINVGAPGTHPVIYQYTGTFSDPAKGEAAATTQFQQGAVVSYNVAGSTGNGIFTAAQKLAQPGATMGPPFGIGVDSDQDWVAPGFVLASQMKRVDTAVFQSAQLALNGTFKSTISKQTPPGVLTLGMNSGAVAISTVNDVNTFLQIAQTAGKSVNPTTVGNQITQMRNAVTAKCGDIYSTANHLGDLIKSGQVKVPYVLTSDLVKYWRSRYG